GREEGEASRRDQSGTPAEAVPDLQEARDEGRFRRQEGKIRESRSPERARATLAASRLQERRHSEEGPSSITRLTADNDHSAPSPREPRQKRRPLHQPLLRC